MKGKRNRILPILLALLMTGCSPVRAAGEGLGAFLLLEGRLTGDLARNCKEILTDIAEHHGWIIQKIETDKDHVHMLLQYPPTDCISGIVQCMKQQSTFKMWQLYETELRHLYWYQNTLWSKGYFYCSIGDVSTKIIEQYIENQG